MFDFILKDVNSLDPDKDIWIYTMPNYYFFKKVDDYIGAIGIKNNDKIFILPINHPDYPFNPSVLQQLDNMLDNWKGKIISINRPKDYHIFNFKRECEECYYDYNVAPLWNGQNYTSFEVNAPYLKLLTLYELYDIIEASINIIDVANVKNKADNKIFKTLYYLNQNDRGNLYSIGHSLRISPIKDPKKYTLDNDIKISIDFNAYHPRLIANHIGFKYNPNKNFYNEVGIPKDLMFKIIYNPQFFDILHKDPFLAAIQENRDMFEGLTLPYWAHRQESLRNSDIVENIFNLLSDRESKIASYLYDEITFDFSYKDIKLLKTILEIMEQDGYTVKLKFFKN